MSDPRRVYVAAPIYLDPSTSPAELPDSVVLPKQIRSIDTKRRVRRLGKLTPETMAEVDRAILISLGLLEL